jgi:hypothetical protein
MSGLHRCVHVHQMLGDIQACLAAGNSVAVCLPAHVMLQSGDREGCHLFAEQHCVRPWGACPVARHACGKCSCMRAARASTCVDAVSRDGAERERRRAGIQAVLLRAAPPAAALRPHAARVDAREPPRASQPHCRLLHRRRKSQAEHGQHHHADRAAQPLGDRRVRDQERHGRGLLGDGEHGRDARDQGLHLPDRLVPRHAAV